MLTAIIGLTGVLLGVLLNGFFVEGAELKSIQRKSFRSANYQRMKRELGK